MALGLYRTESLGPIYTARSPLDRFSTLDNFTAAKRKKIVGAVSKGAFGSASKS